MDKFYIVFLLPIARSQQYQFPDIPSFQLASSSIMIRAHYLQYCESWHFFSNILIFKKLFLLLGHSLDDKINNKSVNLNLAPHIFVVESF